MSEKQKIQRVLNEWYSRGFNGEWSGYFHFMSDELTEVENGYRIYVDFGSAYILDAVDHLILMLENAGCKANSVYENGGYITIY